MRIDLREIINIPGASVPFSCELDTAALDFPSVESFTAPVTASGTISNSAGALTLRGTLTAEMIRICDRCAKEFAQKKVLELDVPLAAELEDEENPDIFLLDGDELDLDELLETCFILDLEVKCLCREDCAGLCPKCGKDLNGGACDCRKEIDPRMAVLEQLLDKF